MAQALGVLPLDRPGYNRYMTDDERRPEQRGEAMPLLPIDEGMLQARKPSHIRIPIRGDILSMSVRVETYVASRQTEFQQIDVYDTIPFGRMLTLDGHIQLTTLDEAAYHESLVQVPMLNLDEPKSALVVGGGDGGVLRELCRHRGLERIDMVEIDRGVVDVCEQHLGQVSDGAFFDRRVRLFIEDAFGFVKRASEPYDLIVMDSTDVYEEEDGGLSEQLFTPEFYRDCRALLAPGGILVTQADNPLFCPYSLEAIRATFGQVFTAVGSYWALVPSFGGYSAFCWASHGTRIASTWPAEVEVSGLKYLTPATYAMGQGPLPFASGS